MRGRKSKGPSAPKLPQFRYSTRNKSDAAYRDRLRVLKDKFGVEFKFAKSAKLTPQRKTAITKKLRSVREFLNPENNFQYVPLSKGRLKAIKGNKSVAEAQTTSGGVFLPKPKPSKGKKSKRTKFKITSKGEVTTRTGNFTSVFRLYPSADVVRDPQMIMREAKELGAESIFVSIKGHRGGSRKNGYSLKAFMRYMNEQILPDMEEQQGEEGEDEDEEFIFRRGRKSSAFKNWFGVEFVIYDWKQQ